MYLSGFTFNLMLFITTLFLSLSLLSIFVVTSPIFIIFLIYNYFTSYNDNKYICNKLELEIIESRNINMDIKHQWNDINVFVGNKIIKSNIHSLVITNKKKIKKPTLIWIHGIGGTSTFSFILSGLGEKLVEDFDIHAIDLPGFGRSTLEFNNYNKNELNTLFSEILKEYIEINKLNDIYLVSHSYGCHVSINFIHKYPTYVNKLLLCNPAGIFPLLGTYGSYVSVLFKFGIPMFIIRLLNMFGLFLFNVVGLFSKNKSKLFYWYYVQSLSYCDYFVSKFIDYSIFKARWNYPTINKLIDVKIPISLIYTNNDIIIPDHQGWMISLLSNGTIPLYIIENGGHSPMHINNGLDFSVIVKKAYHNEVKSNFNSELKKINYNDYYSYFSLYKTKQTMYRFYKTMLSFFYKLTNKINLPSVYIINQDNINKTHIYDKLYDEYMEN